MGKNRCMPNNLTRYQHECSIRGILIVDGYKLHPEPIEFPGTFYSSIFPLIVYVTVNLEAKSL